MDIVFQTLMEVAVPALIWAWCFIRARQYGHEIIAASEREAVAAEHRLNGTVTIV
jgi:hypothetical protein